MTEVRGLSPVRMGVLRSRSQAGLLSQSGYRQRELYASSDLPSPYDAHGEGRKLRVLNEIPEGRVDASSAGALRHSLRPR